MHVRRMHAGQRPITIAHIEAKGELKTVQTQIRLINVGSDQDPNCLKLMVSPQKRILSENSLVSKHNT